jgi:tetratricopeptide (TPR) repeat protein
MVDRRSLEHLRRRVEANPASIAFATLAEEYRRAGMLDEAIATCRAGLRRHPAYVSARVTLGAALIDAAQYDDARSELEAVLRTVPENLAAIRGLAAIDAFERGEVLSSVAQSQGRDAQEPQSTGLPDARATAGPESRLEYRQVEGLDHLLAAIQVARAGGRVGR